MTSGSNESGPVAAATAFKSITRGLRSGIPAAASTASTAAMPPSIFAEPGLDEDVAGAAVRIVVSHADRAARHFRNVLLVPLIA